MSLIIVIFRNKTLIEILTIQSNEHVLKKSYSKEVSYKSLAFKDTRSLKRSLCYKTVRICKKKKLVIYINRSFHYGLSKSTVQMENYNAAKIGKKEKHQKKVDIE